MECSDNFGGLGIGDIQECAPFIRGGKAAGFKSGDNAKTVGAILKSTSKIGIFYSGSYGECSRSKNDIVANNVEAHQTEPRAEN